MSTLLLFLPPRSRLHAPRPAAVTPGASGTPGAQDYDYLLCSPDGGHVTSQGRAPAALLPHAALVIAIPAESDVSWQRVSLPKAGRQMRAALAGLLEENLLDEPESLHFALAPEAAGGEQAWVAVCSRAALAQQLAELEAAHILVDRVTPLSWPEAPARGHFHETAPGSGRMALRWSHAEGIATLALDGSLARQLFPPALVESAQWSAAPAVAAQAEQWLGAPVAVLTPEQRALAVIDSPWNLRQFELAQRTRGIRALRKLGRTLMQRQWRPVRWGLVGLLIVQLLGLNVMAWQQKQQLKERRAALDMTLRQTYPQVRNILDAPVQMRRETETLRASAGRAGDQDFETLLAAAATAWPANRGPVDALSFEPGRLTLSANGWNEQQVQQFRSQLRSEGWQLDSSEGRLVLSRAAASTNNIKTTP